MMYGITFSAAQLTFGILKGVPRSRRSGFGPYRIARCSHRQPGTFGGYELGSGGPLNHIGAEPYPSEAGKASFSAQLPLMHALHRVAKDLAKEFGREHGDISGDTLIIREELPVISVPADSVQGQKHSSGWSS
jgi:hypothetical protein